MRNISNESNVFWTLTIWGLFFLNKKGVWFFPWLIENIWVVYNWSPGFCWQKLILALYFLHWFILYRNWSISTSQARCLLCIILTMGRLFQSQTREFQFLWIILSSRIILVQMVRIWFVLTQSHNYLEGFLLQPRSQIFPPLALSGSLNHGNLQVP